MSEYGPQLLFSEQLHAEKYRHKRETFREAMIRVASGLKDNRWHERVFLDALLNQSFMPAGRIQAAIGSPKVVTPYNCLSGEALILTREYGAVPIASVAGESVTLLDGNQNWVKCPILDHGEQDTYELLFKGGYESIQIRSTLGHGWIRPGRNATIKTASFTKTHKRITIDHLTIDKHSLANGKEYNNGIVHGIIYGDGTKGNGVYKIRVCDKHTDTEPYLEEYPKSYPLSGNGDPVYYISFGKTWSDLKQLPSTPCTSLSYLLGFLRGWFLADGCVSTQPGATLCCGPEEEKWLKQWAPLVGWYTTGSTTLLKDTNYGCRNKSSRNVHLKKAGMIADDFLVNKHRERWLSGKHPTSPQKDWRIHGAYCNRRTERVYCPVVPTTHSFALANGVHSQNCFVSGTIEDSFVDGEGSIMHRAAQAAQTMRMGGGIGYDFSTLRPKGELIKRVMARTDGPLAFLPIYDAVCKATSSAGNRRGAQMGVMRVDHPDIEEFVLAKQQIGVLEGFNLSVAVTDEFMNCLQQKKPFMLRWGGRNFGEIDPTALWETIMRGTWDWGEPGVLFIDTINNMNNLYFCETISATNPCAEQPLPPFGACLLGSFNLVKYIYRDSLGYQFDHEQFVADIGPVIRAMDNVVDRAIYPLPEQEQEAKNKRRMGLGVTGLANALETLGHEYGSENFLKAQEAVLKTLRDTAYMASAKLAKEKGAFPLFDKQYLEAPFIQALPDDVRDAIAKYGIRNSHLTSIAPTGTISMCADNVSSGIEPVFEYESQRLVNMPEGQITVDVSDYGYRELGVEGKLAADVTAEEHVAVLKVASQYVDSAVSKTCNVDGSMPWEDFKNIYVDAWQSGCKGCTTFNKDGKRMGILLGKTEESQCSIDPETGRKECS